VAIDDPPLLLGRVLADRLRRAGVMVRGKVRRVRSNEVKLTSLKPVCVSRARLSDAIRRANKRSLNLAAECIFLRAGDGTWAGSARAMEQTLTRRFGLKAQELVIRDGGGLSRRNRITPASMTKLLVRMTRRSDFTMLLRSLPVNGVDGTLAQRLNEPAIRGRIAAKTGHLTGVSCLSGYVLNPAGQPAVAFSILIDRAKRGAKELQDDLCRLLVKHALHQTTEGTPKEPAEP